MEYLLSQGALADIFHGKSVIAPVLQVLASELVESSDNYKYRFKVADGINFISIAFLTSYDDGKKIGGVMETYCIIRLDKFTCEVIPGRGKILVLEKLSLIRTAKQIGHQIGTLVSLEDNWPQTDGIQMRPLRIQELYGSIKKKEATANAANTTEISLSTLESSLTKMLAMQSTTFCEVTKKTMDLFNSPEFESKVLAEMNKNAKDAKDKELNAAIFAELSDTTLLDHCLLKAPANFQAEILAEMNKSKHEPCVLKTSPTNEKEALPEKSKTTHEHCEGCHVPDCKEPIKPGWSCEVNSCPNTNEHRLHACKMELHILTCCYQKINCMYCTSGPFTVRSLTGHLKNCKHRTRQFGSLGKKVPPKSEKSPSITDSSKTVETITPNDLSVDELINSYKKVSITMSKTYNSYNMECEAAKKKKELKESKITI